MIKKGKLSRRSFLSVVTGSVVAAGSVGVLTGAPAHAQVSDSDTGQSADPVGRGRSSARSSQTRVTDSDSGTNADQAGYGRGSSTADRAGQGRRCSDSDAGSRSDPGGRGRSCSDSDGR